MSMLERVRADLRDFTLYTPGDGDDSLIRLHANELPFRAEQDRSDRGLHRYPLGRDGRLRQRLAELYDVEAAHVLVTRGSDDGIDLLIRTFCTAGQDNIVTTRPGFGMYPALARLQGCATLFVDLSDKDGFDVNIQSLIGACTDHTKLMFLCSPNNPSGRALSNDTVRNACRALAQHAVVVVDEAYVEFCDSPSASTLLDEFDNLVVLRTLSKAYGLAGARVGAVLGPPDVVATLDRLLTPFPLPSPCVDAALAATGQDALNDRRRQWADIARERDALRAALQETIGVHGVWRSDANFLLCDMDAPRRVVAHCQSRGLLVRLIAGVERDYVRITIGTPSQNQQALAAIGETTA